MTMTVNAASEVVQSKGREHAPIKQKSRARRTSGTENGACDSPAGPRNVGYDSLGLLTVDGLTVEISRLSVTLGRRVESRALMPRRRRPAARQEQENLWQQPADAAHGHPGFVIDNLPPF